MALRTISNSRLVDGLILDALDVSGNNITFLGSIINTIDDTDNYIGLNLTNNDTTNNLVTAQITNATTGDSAFYDTNGDAITIRIDSEATTKSVIDADCQNTSGDVFKFVNNGAQTSGSLYRLVQQSSSSTQQVMWNQNNGTGDNVLLDKNNSGNVFNIDQDANDANPCYGVVMDIANAGAGTEYAFRFNGSEIVSAAVGGSQDKKIRVSIGGVDYFIPLHTA